MSLVKKYDRRLRKIALRPVWLPGTLLQVGDILHKKGEAFVSVGNLSDYDIPYTSSPIANNQSISMQAQGVSHSVFQNQAKVNIGNIEASINAELRISFNREYSYFIRTPNLNGVGLDKALKTSDKVARLAEWDFKRNFIVHKIWAAEDFVFLGSDVSGHEVVFEGKGDAIKDLLDNGISSSVSLVGQNNISFEVKGKSGPIVMQVFRVKRDGTPY